MQTMRLVSLYLGLAEAEEEERPRWPQQRTWKVAGTVALAAFAFAGCGDDLPCVIDELDEGGDALDDGGDDDTRTGTQTRTRTQTRTGKSDDTATACTMNTSTGTQTRTRTGRQPR